jgi:uncharacterized protein (TIGR01777 family)
MKVFLTGGTGFIGRHVVPALVERGDRCVVVSRGTAKPWNSDAVELVKGDPTRSGPWQQALDGCDAVVNLAGNLIVDPPHRWTDQKKIEIRRSRAETTRCVADGLREAKHPPRVLVSMSGVNYYGSRGDRQLDETASPGSDFLARVCIEWEEAARAAEDVTRVAIMRGAPVLGLGGGVLAPMLPPFKLGVGGPWGPGTQWWPWIHITDLVGLLLLALEREVRGAVNAAAPNPVTVNEFAKTLGDALHRPSFTRMPEFALRIALGEAADLLLASMRVVPRRALDLGYEFRFPEVRAALEDVVGG